MKLPMQEQTPTPGENDREKRMTLIAAFRKNLSDFENNTQLSEGLYLYGQTVVLAAKQFANVASKEINDYDKEQKLISIISLLDETITMVNQPHIDMKQLNEKLQDIETYARAFDDPKNRSHRRLRKCLDVIGFGLLAMGAIGLIAMVYVGTAGAAAIPTTVMLPPIIAFFASFGVGGAFLLPRLCSDSSKTKKFAHDAISHSLFSFRDKVKDAAQGIDPNAPFLFSRMHRAMR